MPNSTNRPIWSFVAIACAWPWATLLADRASLPQAQKWKRYQWTLSGAIRDQVPSWNRNARKRRRHDKRPWTVIDMVAIDRKPRVWLNASRIRNTTVSNESMTALVGNPIDCCITGFEETYKSYVHQQWYLRVSKKTWIEVSLLYNEHHEFFFLAHQGNDGSSWASIQEIEILFLELSSLPWSECPRYFKRIEPPVLSKGSKQIIQYWIQSSRCVKLSLKTSYVGICSPQYCHAIKVLKKLQSSSRHAVFILKV